MRTCKLLNAVACKKTTLKGFAAEWMEVWNFLISFYCYNVFLISVVLVLCFYYLSLSLSSQIVAHTRPESQRRRADELCDASPTPRIQQTPLPPSPRTTPLPLCPPMPLDLLPLTTGSAPPPPGPYSPLAAWAPRWLRQRGGKVPGRHGTGSG